MSDDFSIRMKEDGLAPPASLFAPRPDKRDQDDCNFTIMGAILTFDGWGDLNSMADDFPDADLDAI